MIRASWNEVRSLFEEALSLPVDERAAFLDVRCGDARRRDEVQALLTADARSDSVTAWLDGGPDASWLALAARLGRSVEGIRIGDYELRGVLAHGGMGTIYEAVQLQPRRVVALKMLRLGMSSAAARRFQVEAEILGQLRHPAIAKVFGAGFVRDAAGGRAPYFSMELVEGGRPLTTAADERGLPLRARLELFLAVCEGVQYSHEHGVIHRDLKPANILLDASGRPRIIDFGIARLATGGPAVTAAGELLGTLQYMSPEQLLGEHDVVGVRSDVYALGVILHELCCGRPPHDVEQLSPGRAAAWLTEHGPPSARAVRPELSRDLDCVIACAADPDRERRYASAAALTEDVRRLLADVPVLAGAPDTAAQLRRFLRRHRLALAVASAVLVVLVGSLLGVGLALVRARDAEHRQAQALQLAEERLVHAAAESRRTAATNDFFESMLLAAEPDAQGRDVRVADVLARAAGRLSESFAGEPALEASLQDTCGRLYLGLGMLEDAERHLGRALAMRREILPPGDEETLGTMQRLSRVLQIKGRLDEAEALLREALAGRVALRGERDRDTLAAMSRLGMLLNDRGRLDEAEVLLRTTAGLQQEVLGESAEATLVTLAFLADIEMTRGRLDETEALCSTVLRALAAAGRSDHLTALSCGCQLARIAGSRGHLDDAESLARRTFLDSERALGPNHRRTLSTMSLLADLLRARGQDGESLALQERVRAAMLAQHEPGHRDAISSAHDLGLTLMIQGRLVAAEPLLREAVEGARAIWGERHRITASYGDDLARCLLERGSFEEAERLLLAAKPVVEEALGVSHPDTLHILGDIVLLYERRGCFDEAAAWNAELSRRAALAAAAPVSR